MKRFKFEIQECIQVEVRAPTKEEARQELINNLSDYAKDMVSPSCYVSDGEEIK